MEFYDKFCGYIPGPFERGLLSPRRRSNNYLELPRENGLGNSILSHWPCLMWYFIMVWFHKFLELVFHKQPSCPKKIFGEHWTKLPNLTLSIEQRFGRTGVNSCAEYVIDKDFL